MEIETINGKALTFCQIWHEIRSGRRIRTEIRRLKGIKEEDRKTEFSRHSDDFLTV